MALVKALALYAGQIAQLAAGDTVTDWNNIQNRPAVREVLTASRTYFVRADGSDSNTGLVNNAGGAFLTIQKAVDVAVTLDFSGFDLTIQVATGTYTGVVVLKTLLSVGTAIVLGNETTPANVLINVTGTCFNASGLNSVWNLRGMKLQATGIGIDAIDGSFVKFQNINFGACNIHASAEANAVLEVTGNYSITGDASIHARMSQSAVFRCQSRTVTLTGTPDWTTAMVQATLGGVAHANANTYSGAATGKRYAITSNGVINSGAGGANYFPGNVAGTAATGGEYI